MKTLKLCFQLLQSTALFAISFMIKAQTLSSPILLSPANNAVNQSPNVTLIWKGNPNVDQYKVALGKSLYAEGSIVWDTTYADTSYLISNLPTGKYYWRIKAKHTPDPYTASNWSGVSSFSVVNPNSPLSVPVLVSPSNGASIQNSVVSLNWQAVSGADHYQVSLGTNSNGTSNILLDTNYVGTSYTKSGLNPGTYYWRIKAKKSSPYQLSQWSAISSFNLVVGALGAPVLITPSNNSIFQILGTNLSWQAVQSATFYKVKIATDAAMTNIIFQDTNVISINRVAQNLDYNTIYYWTVQAGNSNTTGPVSNTKTFQTMPDNPDAVNSHPRILLTQGDLPTLRNWAVPSNPVFIALQNALNTAISNYNTNFYPGGQPNPNWPDNGSVTWSGYVSESYAEFFAFWSLIDPIVSNRPIHAQRARNLLMYVIDQAYLGTAVGVPFRDPQFMTYDRSRVYGEACPLTVDWIYNAKDANNNDILTTADKAKIKAVFLRWCGEQLNAYNHPTPVGLMNDKQITLTNPWILNNYFSGHARNVTFMALSMDAMDDSPVNASLPYSALGNSVRSYIYNATGAWLYQQYAQYEKPEIVASDYNVSPTNLGKGSGGLSVEGSLYGESIGWVAQELLALKTAGWLDETIIGKQAKLYYSDYWTRLMDGLLHSIAPAPYVAAQASYLGQIYSVANYGDLLRTWMTPFMLDVTGSIGLIDIKNGNNQNRLDKTRWFSRNALEGGSATLLGRIANIWPSSLATEGITYFMLLPPAISNPPDPRPTMSTVFWDPSFNKVLARTDWTPNATWFNWQCHWTSINHQSGDGNQFEFYRKGEWLTKERSGYTNDGIGSTSEFHNTMALQNDVPGNLQWYETPTSQRGGQWKEGQNAGDPSTKISIGNNLFVYATGDATNLYNRPNQFSSLNAATDILHASRSIVWLKPDYIIVYDRAKSNTQNRFKRFFLQFTASPNVSGKFVTVHTPGGQKLFVSNLLPSAAVITPSVSENINSLAELETTTNQIKIEDPSNPQDIRFLNVLQGADGNAVKDSVILVQSTSGTNFDGVIVNNTAVLFQNVWNAAFNFTTYSIPNAVQTQIVSGLTPNAGYDVSFVTNGNIIDVTITPGTQINADAGGVLFIDNSLMVNSIQLRSGKVLKINKMELQISPNPFEGSTTIQFELEESADVSLEIFDLDGKKLETLVDKQRQPKGLHEYYYQTKEMNPGIYVCKLTIGNNQLSRMMIVNTH